MSGLYMDCDGRLTGAPDPSGLSTAELARRNIVLEMEIVRNDLEVLYGKYENTSPMPVKDDRRWERLMERWDILRERLRLWHEVTDRAAQWGRDLG